MTNDLARNPAISAIDWSVLAAQSGGDAALEAQVLRLFLAKSADDFARITSAANAAERHAAAHGLVGSARAVGAGEVARLAQHVEWTAAADASGLSDLADALAAVRAQIDARLAGAKSG